MAHSTTFSFTTVLTTYRYYMHLGGVNIDLPVGIQYNLTCWWHTATGWSKPLVHWGLMSMSCVALAYRKITSAGSHGPFNNFFIYYSTYYLPVLHAFRRCKYRPTCWHTV